MCIICQMAERQLTLTASDDTLEPLAAPAVLDRSGTAANGKPIYSSEQAAAQITRSGDSWSSVLGTGATVSYAYRSTAPASMPSDTTGFSRFNAVQIAGTELVLAAWADVANLTFTRVNDGDGYSNAATMLFANYSGGQEGAAAFAYRPGGTAPFSLAGDVWLKLGSGDNANPTLWSYGRHVIAHEVGHALGLSHPSNYNADAEADVTYTENAQYFQDSRAYSVMSYFGSTNVGGNLSHFATSPQLDDIAAVQRLYGPNMSTRTGDTIYGFNSNAGREWYVASAATPAPVFAVWDAGGNDTLDFSGNSQNQTLDLRAGSLSSTGGSTFNMGIAVGVTIENATGGSGDDELVGNEAANRLTGGDGGDTLYGGAGGDTLDGGPGIDTASYETAASGVVLFMDGPHLNGGEAAGDTLLGIERILGSASGDIFGGSTLGDTLQGGGGGDYLFGGTGGDRLLGEAGDDLLNGGAGADILDGGDGIDTVSYADAAESVIAFLAGAALNTGEALGDSFTSIERLTGTAFADILGTDEADNRIEGGEGGDYLFAGGGVDVLVGGGGADQQWGGLGADVFLYTALTDSTPAIFDRINDHQSGVDHLDFRPVRAGASDIYGWLPVNGAIFLFVDIGGDGAADFLVVLENTQTFTTADLFW